MTEPAPTVMIIEDERLLRLISTMEFEEEGFKVVALSHGEAALEILASGEQVDLLMTDISLPDSIDGWAIARRARELRPELPVIYVTGYSPDPVQLVAGARFFKKPYLPSAIIEVARGMIDAANRRAGEGA